MMLHRLALLTRRFFRARDYGVTFTGTTGFQMPKAIRFGNRSWPLETPPEVGLGSDFINLLLDDDYGFHDLPPDLKTVLDVGANCGLFSLLAAHRLPVATIHAYEPNPRVFPYTKKNLAPAGVTCFQAGVGSQSGFASMEDAGESRLAQTKLADDGQVRIVSLAEAVDRLGGGLDLLKLDCEGAEWDIFLDADTFRKIRRVRMEYHLDSRHDLDALRAIAAALGYRIDKLLPNQGFGLAWFSRPA